MIANGYAFSGRIESLVRIAPARLYLCRMGPKAFAALVLTTALMAVAHWYNIPVDKIDFANLNLQVFPNLLGFGIGIFALIFTIKPELVLWLRDNGKKEGIDEQLMVVDLAYPLIVIAAILLVSVALKFVPAEPPATSLAVFCLLYGIAMIFELIAFIYVTACKVLRDIKPRATEAGSGSAKRREGGAER